MRATCFAVSFAQRRARDNRNQIASRTAASNNLPNFESVCRIEDGSTHAYLKEDRLIQEFLKTIEPKYNAASSPFTDPQDPPF